MISPRDFVFVSHKVPPGDVGGAFGAQAFVQVTNTRRRRSRMVGLGRPGGVDGIDWMDSTSGGP